MRDQTDGLYAAGSRYLRMQILQKAEELFVRTLKLQPDHFDALNGLGVVYTSKRDYPSALEYYRKASSLAPENPEFRLNIAITNFLMGKRTEARNISEGGKRSR